LDLIRVAQHDLHEGPISRDDADDQYGVRAWPGFQRACTEIRDALRELCGDLWITEDGCIATSEPVWADCGNENCGGCDEPCGENPADWSIVQHETFRRIVLGELAEYVS
jgi:hypothetical protein